MQHAKPIVLFLLIGGLVILGSCATTTQSDEPTAVTASAEVVDDWAYFETPDAAVDVLLAALKDNDREALLGIFGTAYRDLIETSDEAAEDARRRQFWDAANVLRMLEERGEDERILVVGSELWPFPIPIVRGEEGWYYDTEEGYEEVIDRRVGANELNAIAVCREYVIAQMEYAAFDRDGDDVREFAQRLGSSEGQRDGLYWPVDPDTDELLSPFGELVASAEEYLEGVEPGGAFKGYHFRILTAQGPIPPGGRYDYVINGNMIAGFALIAFPAEYGSTGVMTFLVNHQGLVYDKDLGEDTLPLAKAIAKYDPDDSWELVID